MNTLNYNRFGKKFTDKGTRIHQLPILISVYFQICKRWRKGRHNLPKKKYPWKLGGKGAWKGIGGHHMNIK